MRTTVLSALLIVALATSSHALSSKRTYTLVAHHGCDASLNPDLIVQATINTCHAKCDAIGCWCFDHSSVDGDTTCRLSVGNAKVRSTSQLNSWTWDQAPPPGSTPGPPPSHYLPQWNSVSRHPNPSWFTDSKFGIYAHWGPFSVPAFHPGSPSGGTWYSKDMYQPGSRVNKHHVETYGDPATFGFKEFIPLLNGSGFDPKKWAALYRRAGAQYAGPVTAFADGFFMYDSKHTDYNAAKMGPKRDVVGEVVAAVRAEGLKVITSLHHSWLWTWYPTWNASLARDVADPKYQLTASHGGLYGPGVANKSDIPAQCYPYLSPKGGRYGPDNCSVTEGVVGAFATNQRFMGYWLDIAQEVAAKYKPDVMWFDSNMRQVVDGAHRTRFLAGFYNDALAAKQEVVVTYKGQDMRAGAGVLDYERGGVGDIQSSVWQTDDSMDRSCWCWCKPMSLKPQTELIGELVDIVSKGGNLLLNAPPRTDGSFDERVIAPLLAIGRWLGASGAGIYKTVPWRVYGEGPTKISPGSFHEWPTFTHKDFRFTAAKDGKAVFVFLMAWASDASFAVTSLNNSTERAIITNVTILGSKQKVSWRVDATALHVDAIGELPPDMQADCAVGLRVHFGGASVGEIDAPTDAIRKRVLRE